VPGAGIYSTVCFSFADEGSHHFYFFTTDLTTDYPIDEGVR
jgi:hypothetical protein